MTLPPPTSPLAKNPAVFTFCNSANLHDVSDNWAECYISSSYTHLASFQPDRLSTLITQRIILSPPTPRQKSETLPFRNDVLTLYFSESECLISSLSWDGRRPLGFLLLFWASCEFAAPHWWDRRPETPAPDARIKNNKNGTARWWVMMPQRGHSISCQSEPRSREADWILELAGQLQHEPTCITQTRARGPETLGDLLVASLPVAELV